MPHPLDGAFKRVNRADVHIRELETLVERFRKQYEYEIVPENNLTERQILQHFFDKKSIPIMGIYNRPVDEIPEDIPIIVGETVYNLRASLDYLVYELSGRRSGTQFPIEDCKLSKDGKYGFDTRRKTFLNGLTDAHVAAIEALQPYAGCKWAKTLRDISNPDKHRHLAIVHSNWEETITFLDGSENSPKEADISYPERAVDLKHTVNVTLPDGAPIIELLKFVKSSIAGVLITFESEFK